MHQWGQKLWILKSVSTTPYMLLFDAPPQKFSKPLKTLCTFGRRVREDWAPVRSRMACWVLSKTDVASALHTKKHGGPGLGYSASFSNCSGRFYPWPLLPYGRNRKEVFHWRNTRWNNGYWWVFLVILTQYCSGLWEIIVLAVYPFSNAHFSDVVCVVNCQVYETHTANSILFCS